MSSADFDSKVYTHDTPIRFFLLVLFGWFLCLFFSFSGFIVFIIEEMMDIVILDSALKHDGI